jgi:hypothetical protein
LPLFAHSRARARGARESAPRRRRFIFVFARRGGGGGGGALSYGVSFGKRAIATDDMVAADAPLPQAPLPVLMLDGCRKHC